jgi:hypothetical protein
MQYAAASGGLWFITIVPISIVVRDRFNMSSYRRTEFEVAY